MSGSGWLPVWDGGAPFPMGPGREVLDARLRGGGQQEVSLRRGSLCCWHPWRICKGGAKWRCCAAVVPTSG